ncbi:MAG: CHAP domain-containing protein [Rubrivivax sp.]|jgi:hypothetical protein
MDLDTFLARAHRALQQASFYWLGNGGWLQGQSATEWPATPFDITSALVRKQREEPAVHARYLAEEARSGIDRSTLPKLACDCSGYVCWALGISRNGWPDADDWFNTDGMLADAAGAQRGFVPLAKAVPGALLVHPRPSREGGPGHVGIVTEVDAQGRATRMLHCAAANYLLQPPPGLPRTAFAETDTRYFDGEKTSVLIWKAFV